MQQQSNIMCEAFPPFLEQIWEQFCENRKEKKKGEKKDKWVKMAWKKKQTSEKWQRGGKEKMGILKKKHAQNQLKDFAIKAPLGHKLLEAAKQQQKLCSLS